MLTVAVRKKTPGEDLVTLPKHKKPTANYFSFDVKKSKKSRQARLLSNMLASVIFHGHLGRMSRVIQLLGSIFPILNQSNTPIIVKQDKFYVHVSNQIRMLPKWKYFSYHDSTQLNYATVVDHLLSFKRELKGPQKQNQIQQLDMAYLQLLYIKYLDTHDVAGALDARIVLTVFGERYGQSDLFGMKISDWVSLIVNRKLRFIESTPFEQHFNEHFEIARLNHVQREIHKHNKKDEEVSSQLLHSMQQVVTKFKLKKIVRIFLISLT